MTPGSRTGRGRCAFVLVMLLGCCFDTGHAQDPMFTFTLLPAGDPESRPPRAASINLSGAIVGNHLDVERSHGVYMEGCCAGEYATIQHPKGVHTQTTGINDHGSIVGYYGNKLSGPAIEHGYLLENGEFTTIDYPGALSTRIAGINNAGEIVGYAKSPHAGFLYKDGEFIEIVCPAGGRTYPLAINNKHEIVGRCVPDHLFLWSGGEISILDFDAPVSHASIAPRGINDRGDIVGSYYADDEATGRPKSIGFILTGARTNPVFRTLYPGSGTVITGINNDGKIVGYMATGSFLATEMGTGSGFPVSHP